MGHHDTEEAAARYAALSVSTLRKRRRLGLPPVYIKVGRRIVYAKQDVDAFLLAGRVDREQAESQS